MKYWFKRKRYGWGWVPVTWQGWLIIIIYMLVIIAGVMSLRDVTPDTFNREFGFYALIVTLATISLLRITYRTAPRPKWRWGAKPIDKSDEDY